MAPERRHTPAPTTPLARAGEAGRGTPGPAPRPRGGDANLTAPRPVSASERRRRRREAASLRRPATSPSAAPGDAARPVRIITLADLRREEARAWSWATAPSGLIALWRAYWAGRASTPYLAHPSARWPLAWLDRIISILGHETTIGAACAALRLPEVRVRMGWARRRSIERRVTCFLDDVHARGHWISDPPATWERLGVREEEYTRIAAGIRMRRALALERRWPARERPEAEVCAPSLSESASRLALLRRRPDIDGPTHEARPASLPRWIEIRLAICLRRAELAGVYRPRDAGRRSR